MTDYVTDAFVEELEKLAKAGALGAAKGWLAGAKERVTGLASAASAKLKRMGASLKRGKEVTKPPSPANMPDKPKVKAFTKKIERDLGGKADRMLPPKYKYDPKVVAEFGHVLGKQKRITDPRTGWTAVRDSGGSGRVSRHRIQRPGKTVTASVVEHMFDELERIVGEVAG